MKTKIIAVTMGEPGGIGPEVIVKALHCADIRTCCTPFIIGDAAVMRDAIKITGLSFKIRPISNMSHLKPVKGCIEVLDIKCNSPFLKGVPSKNAGRAVVSYIRKAVDLALKNEVSAIVTAPISKESLKMAGYKWPGHTEFLAGLTKTKDFAMMFVSDMTENSPLYNTYFIERCTRENK